MGDVFTGGHGPYTFAGALQPATLGSQQLLRRHSVLPAVVHDLLGFVPNEFQYLAIWPPGFRYYNLLIATFLDLPRLVLSGGDLKKLVGLVMYASSRAAQCAYCSAHSCSFALRRGASAIAVAEAFNTSPGRADFDSGQLAALDIAEAAGRLPATVTAVQRQELRRFFSPSEVDHLVLAIALMGLLNKFCDGLGIPLEDEPLHDAASTIGATGWDPGQHGELPADWMTARAKSPSVDSLGTKLGLIPRMPSLVRRELSWTAGVPSTWPAVGGYLKSRSGHDFPVLSRMRSRRAIRALATALRDSTDPRKSELGLRNKYLAGVAYATHAADDELVRGVDVLAEGAGATVAQRAGGVDELDAVAISTVRLAQALASSPAQVTPDVVAESQLQLTPPAIVELVTWLGLLQLIHRLHVLYEPLDVR